MQRRAVTVRGCEQSSRRARISFVHLPMAAGMGPVSLFMLRKRPCRFCRSPIHSGIDPVSWLPPTSKFSSERHWPMASMIVPPRPHAKSESERSRRHASVLVSCSSMSEKVQFVKSGTSFVSDALARSSVRSGHGSRCEEHRARVEP